MSPEELVYLGVLAASVPAGFLFRYLSSSAKQTAALFLGLFITVALCHIHTLHSLVTVIGTWIIIKSSWRSASHPELVTNNHLPKPNFYSSMVSLANEVHSFHVEKKRDVSAFAKSPVIGGLSQEPSLYDILSYSYCYVGIMTGPFFRFQTYVDWLEQPRPLALPSWEPCLQRLKMIPVFGAFFLAVNHYFPLSYVRTDEFLDQNFLFRLFYMVAVFFVFRMRFYAAWCGAEAGCISAGLGCYPEKALSKPGGGPTVNYNPDPTGEEKYDFKTIQNIDCYNTDYCVKVRHGMRYWNMTVQWWLHHYIYPNAPFKSYALRAGWTMLISAYWHGLHAGYYLSFLTIPLCIAAESAMESAVRAKLGPGGQNVFDWIHWFLKMRAYDYMCMGFVLLKASDTIDYWSSIYFTMHVVAVGCLLVGRVLKGGRREGRKGEKEQARAEGDWF
uniref:Leukocyte receptor cluster member 4 n=1 Tax=Fundulus heteroclitus TaxID=8078 RepID=A0A3Q2NUB5_FUNHE